MPLAIPMLLVMVVTLVSLILNTKAFLEAENWLLFGISSLLLTLIVWMTLEGLSLFLRLLRQRGSDSPDPGR